MTFSVRARRAACIVPISVALAAGPLAGTAQAQLPPGVNPDAVLEMLPQQIAVPAGETTTVDVGVPVDVNYNSGGWSVTSSGSTVTVTAPAQEGATAAVTASAAGYSATINLVAEGGAQAPAGGGAGASGGGEESGTGEGASSAGGEGSAGQGGAGQSAGGSGGAATVAHPPRQAAERVDTTNAQRLYFDGVIEANSLVVKVPLSKARDLMRYANVDTDGAKLRYVDVNGQIIEGVQRDIDIATRTLTLTYPEGETPDNPFIMEVVRDGAAEFIAVITATNAPVEQAGAAAEENPYGEFSDTQSQVEGVDGEASQSSIVPLVVGGTIALTLLALLFVVLGRRKRARA